VAAFYRNNVWEYGLDSAGLISVWWLDFVKWSNEDCGMRGEVS
jgi:hypothetical protein